MIRRALAALLLALSLAACGGGEAGEAGERATARLWVTHDRGARVVLTASVPAGLTVMQALQREADVETRYGGRFVEAIEGVEGSLDEQRDWFFFVNGIEPDVGAAEVRLREGDVAWWDYRSWREQMAQPVAVGAFPEPFHHGWGDERRPAVVTAPPALAVQAQALRRLLGTGGTGEPNSFVIQVLKGAEGATLTATRGAANDAPVTFRLAGSLPAVRAAAQTLVNRPASIRFRYEARFDERGNVLG
ncbi:MAG: DUF4430 domain-containing protein [Gaiellales bacterium]